MLIACLYYMYVFSDGTLIFDETGKNKIGVVTSGSPSPCLKHNVGMGYVDTNHSKIGTKVFFEVRKKLVPGTVAKMPFVPTKYFVSSRKS